MKLDFRQIDAFLKNPDKKIRAILVYGPDSGLVQERAAILGKHYVADLNDPFNVAHLTGDIIADDPARLSDEANARSLMGGMRVVRITGGGAELALALKDWFKADPNPECILIIEAGNLGPKDALRKLCESQELAAALPCYVEDERSLSTLIRDTVRAAGLTITADATNWMANSIKGDRLRARMELEKLVLYMGSDEDGRPGNITLEDVQNSCGDAGTQSIDELVYAFGDRNALAALKSFTRLHAEGVAPVTIVRSLQNHVFKLHTVKTMTEQQNMPLDDAMKRLQPPIFFKQKDQFVAQLRQYPLPKLRKILSDINKLEASTKQNGAAPELLISNFLLKSAS